jgi:AbrB family transcriptional regulator (stage V sporulation protein T)
MTETGIVRRVDDLGRVVIPKEVRRSLGIKEGDPLEIFTTRDGEIVFKPHQDSSKVVDNFMETFKEMNIVDKKAILKMLVEEMG